MSKMMQFSSVAMFPDEVLMVWQGTVVEPSEEKAAADALQDLLNLQKRPQILGCTETLPTPDAPEGTTGGRVDLLFAIDQCDVSRAAVQRVGYSDLKWACDIDSSIYEKDVSALIKNASFLSLPLRARL